VKCIRVLIIRYYAQSVDEFAQTCAYLREVSGGRFQFGIGSPTLR
jgi:hypothetical protein